MRLFLLMVIVTTVEVILIAKVGAMIGFFPTLLVIIATAFIGSRLLSKQWRFVMSKLQTLQGNPSDTLLEALILVIGGVLLITPGFLTDIVGFLGLVPPLRERFVKWLRKYSGALVKSGRFGVYTSHSGYDADYRRTDDDDNNVIEGEFERKDDK